MTRGRTRDAGPIPDRTPACLEDDLSQIPGNLLLHSLGFTYVTPAEAAKLRGDRESLVALPMSLIHYVIAHELCHLRVPKHDARFERLLSRLMPDWRQRHERLMLNIT